MGQQHSPRVRSLHVQSLDPIPLPSCLHGPQRANKHYNLRGISRNHDLLLGKCHWLPRSRTAYRQVVELGRCHGGTVPGFPEYQHRLRQPDGFYRLLDFSTPAQVHLGTEYEPWEEDWYYCILLLRFCVSGPHPLKNQASALPLDVWPKDYY